MKKIIAFFLGLILFIGSAIGLNHLNANDLAMNSRDFGIWVNIYKDMSHEAIKLNLNKDTMLVLGSSEFQHGRRGNFHPRKLFRDRDMDLMLIGSAYTQSLFHSTLLASIEPDLKNRKVTLLFSPPWCKDKRVKSNAFAARFSETQYIAMLENPNITKDIKEHIANETLIGLNKFPEMKRRVVRYNRLFLTKDATIGDRIFFFGRKLFIKEKDKVTVLTAMKTTKIRRDLNLKEKGSSKEIRWDKLRDNAFAETLRRAGDNCFYMSDRYYKKKIVPRLDKKKNSSMDASYENSPEYKDLDIFLKICQQTDIKANIIILPINDYWYDYTGFPKEKRDIARSKITDLAKEYGAEVTDLYDNGYEEYLFEDTVHPSQKGWMEINEAIYKFYKEN